MPIRRCAYSPARTKTREICWENRHRYTCANRCAILQDITIYGSIIFKHFCNTVVKQRRERSAQAFDYWIHQPYAALLFSARPVQQLEDKERETSVTTIAHVHNFIKHIKAL